MNEPTPIAEYDSLSAGQPPSFGLRALAKIVDLLILSGLQLVLFCLLSLLDTQGLVGPRVLVVSLTAYLLLAVAYFTLFTCGGWQTYGYRLAGLRVVTIQGEPVGAARSFARAVVDFLALGLLQYGIGLLDYLPIALTRPKRAFHDFLTRTAVVRVAAPRAVALAISAVASVLAPVIIVFLIVRPFLFQAFYIPSPSMEPALQIDDRILVNHLYYRLNPIRHEDIVLFVAPGKVMPGHPDFIKRVAGLPGDVIRTTRGRIVIDGQEYNHQMIRDLLGHAGIFGPLVQQTPMVDQAHYHVRFAPDGVLADGRFVPKMRLAALLMVHSGAAVIVTPGQTWRNGRRLAASYLAEDPDYDLQFIQGQPLLHRYDSDTLTDEYQMDGQTITKSEYDRDRAAPESRTPPGQLVVFGDNRNDSNDSAYWGYLLEASVEGKVTWSFYPRLRRL